MSEDDMDVDDEEEEHRVGHRECVHPTLATQGSAYYSQESQGSAYYSLSCKVMFP